MKRTRAKSSISIVCSFQVLRNGNALLRFVIVLVLTCGRVRQRAGTMYFPCLRSSLLCLFLGYVFLRVEQCELADADGAAWPDCAGGRRASACKCTYFLL